MDHIYTLNFVQVAGLFGFLPMQMTRWACVNSPTSGAYKAINGFFKERNKSLGKTMTELSVTDAEKYFSDAVKWIQSNVSWNFTPAIAENILCELNREKGTINCSEEWCPSPKKDVLYLYKHRGNTLHHLYRWKHDQCGKAVLQVLLMSKDGTVGNIENILEIQSTGVAQY